jgi:hypothetical protein
MRSLFVVLFACVSALFTVLACETPRPVTPDVVLPIPEDAGAEEPTLDAAIYPDCSRACTRLRTLGCEEGLAEEGGLTCYAVCAKAEASGKFSLNPKCVAEAASRDGLRLCKTIRCGRK